MVYLLEKEKMIEHKRIELIDRYVKNIKTNDPHFILLGLDRSSIKAGDGLMLIANGTHFKNVVCNHIEHVKFRYIPVDGLLIEHEQAPEGSPDRIEKITDIESKHYGFDTAEDMMFYFSKNGIHYQWVEFIKIRWS